MGQTILAPSYISLSNAGRLSYQFLVLDIGSFAGHISPLSYGVTETVLRSNEPNQLTFGRQMVHFQGVLAGYDTGSSVFPCNTG